MAWYNTGETREVRPNELAGLIRSEPVGKQAGDAAKTFKGPIREVILHNTASPDMGRWRDKRTEYLGKGMAQADAERAASRFWVQRMHAAHTGMGWWTWGYHWIVTPDGRAWYCRPLRFQGAHVVERNSDTWGVSMLLNGDRELPTGPQAIATANVLGALLERIGVAPEYNFRPGHGFHADYTRHPGGSYKTCPGTRITRAMVIDWIDARDGRTQPNPEPIADPEPEPDVSPWAADAVSLVSELGIMQGRGDGRFGGREPLTREEAAIVICRVLERMENPPPVTDTQAARLAALRVS